jgi:RNase P subunit RPR2
MPLNGRGQLSLEKTNGRPLCPKCRAPLWSIRGEPGPAADAKRTFQCPRCEHSHFSEHTQMSVHFRPKANIVTARLKCPR